MSDSACAQYIKYFPLLGIHGSGIPTAFSSITEPRRPVRLEQGTGYCNGRVGGTAKARTGLVGTDPRDLVPSSGKLEPGGWQT